MENFSFQIATPCHENWDRMTPESQGRFCDACQKCVVDLTAKKQSEIKQLYDAHGGDMCGRMRVAAPLPKRRKLLDSISFATQGLRRLQRFALALILAGGFFFTASSQSMLQGQVVEKMGIVAPTPMNSVEGTVKYEGGKRVQGAKVDLLDEEGYVLESTTTDSHGYYQFDGRWYGKLSISATDGNYAFGNAAVEFGHGTHEKRDIQIKERFLMGDIAPRPERENEKPELLIEPEIDDLEDNNKPDVPHQPEGLPEASTIQSALTAPGNKTEVELEGFGLTVYPNPANDRIFVTARSIPDTQVTLIMTDIHGQIILEQPWKPQLQPIQIIPIGEYATGVYLLSIRNASGETKSTRIVKE